MFWKIYFISDFLWFLKMIQFPFLFFFLGNRQVDFIVFSTSFVSMFWVTLPLKSLCFCIILQFLLCLENLYFFTHSSQMKHFNSLELTSVCWLTLSSAFVLLSPSCSLLFFVSWTSIGASMIESFPSLGFSQEKDLLSLSKMFFILGMTWSMMTSLSWLSRKERAMTRSVFSVTSWLVSMCSWSLWRLPALMVALQSWQTTVSITELASLLTPLLPGLDPLSETIWSIYLEGIFLYILFIANLQSEPN